MKRHTKIYMDYFGFKVAEDCVCEIPECGSAANDLHHIERRGMGGNPSKDKDKIENLMALCRKHHDLYGDVPGYKEYLKKVHIEFMKIRC